MNFFSSEVFLSAFNKTYFPEVTLRLTDFCINEKKWRFPTLPNGKPITAWPYIDYFEPIEQTDTASATAIKRYIPMASLGVETTDDWFLKKLEACYKPAPFIRWGTFADWENFEQHFTSRQSKTLTNLARRHRNLTKNIGEIKFEWHDTRPEVLTTYIQWKSAQFASAKDSFAEQKNVQLFKNLIANNLVIVSSLSAGNQLLAVALSAVWNNRLYFWLTTYDQAHANYSPGNMILHCLMQESYLRGHEEFSFMLGGEGYKWIYATHTRLIGEVAGLMPITRTWVKKQLVAYPQVLVLLKKLKTFFVKTPTSVIAK